MKSSRLSNKNLESSIRALQSYKHTPEFNHLRTGIHSRGYLPHHKKDGVSYFITFRLADTLPQSFIKQMKIQQLNLDRPSEIKRVHRERFKTIEEHLDKSYGTCWLKDPRIASTVQSALLHFNHVRYVLNAWVVMPNHVHVVLHPIGNNLLNKILHSLKGYSARESNRILDREGKPFWQRESFDHWIRDETEKQKCIQYTIMNPVKACLCKKPEEWLWSSAYQKK